jgi:hypothetical protein
MYGRQLVNMVIYLLCAAVFQIRIQIDLALLDPYPYWECESGSKSKDIDQKLTTKGYIL